MDDLHIFFLPFLAPGHMIPMVDVVRLFAGRGTRVTIVTTAGNSPLIRPTLDQANVAGAQPIQLLTVPFPSSETGLPPGLENLTAVRDFGDFLRLLDAADMLEHPFAELARAHRPDCIVSDTFYLWAPGLASLLGVPHVGFQGMSCFYLAAAAGVRDARPDESAAGDDEPFVVPGLPHRVEMTRSQLPLFLLGPDDDNNGLTRRMEPKQQGSLGLLINSFYEMEREYADHLRDAIGLRTWLVGPVSRCNGSALDMVVRGEAASTDYKACLNWLQTKKPGSVLYVCFGSTAVLSAAQVREMAFGLEASGHPFIWAVRHLDDGSLPEGFEDRVTERGKGVVLRGWAPQVLLLGHAGVGGFMTHCGWNSCLEGASAGVPMITWPLGSDQFFNERLLVDVLRVGLGVGIKVSSFDEEGKALVTAEKVREAVCRLMGEGDEAEGRRKRARELGEKARRAGEEGGSSYEDMSRLIHELAEIKSKGCE